MSSNEDGTRRVAFVSGASRGIGKACAVELAAAGFDVAVSARTVQEGEEREHSSTVERSDTSPLPGSLERTMEAIEARGGRALGVPADLLDPIAIAAASARVLAEWGRVDLVVQNARYVGPGHMDRLIHTPLQLIEDHLRVNILAPLALAQSFLPGMIERGSGTFIQMTSASGYCDPPAAAGEGGWGMGYGISKAGAHRIPGMLKAEHECDGIRSFLVHPGLTATERIQADMKDFGFEGGAPPEAIARVVAWLATSPDADVHTGQNIEAQFLCHELGLLPGWTGPEPNVHALGYDHSGARLAALERELVG